MKRILIAVVIMGMAASVHAAEFNDLAVKATDLKTLTTEGGVAVPAVPKGYVVPVKSAIHPERISTAGQAHSIGNGSENAEPINEIPLRTFDMTKAPLMATSGGKDQKDLLSPKTTAWNCGHCVHSDPNVEANGGGYCQYQKYNQKGCLNLANANLGCQWIPAVVTPGDGQCVHSDPNVEANGGGYCQYQKYNQKGCLNLANANLGCRWIPNPVCP